MSDDKNVKPHPLWPLHFITGLVAVVGFGMIGVWLVMWLFYVLPWPK